MPALANEPYHQSHTWAALLTTFGMGLDFALEIISL